jgi:transposase
MSEATVTWNQFYPHCLKIMSVESSVTQFRIFMTSATKSAKCPSCGKRSTKVNSTHLRKAQDLPILDRGVELHILAKRYFCTNKKCPESIFMEQYEQFMGRYARYTNRCKDFITRLALATDAETASKILQSLRIKVSGDTLLRYAKDQGEAFDLPQVKGIGVDDWAYRKRHTYGTIIVDLATHQPLELLEGRDGKAFKAWLLEHPDITVVARDRASAFASAVDEVLPNAIQIADRFHISKNLLDALKLSLSSYLPAKIRLGDLQISKEKEVADCHSKKN